MTGLQLRIKHRGRLAAMFAALAVAGVVSPPWVGNAYAQSQPGPSGAPAPTTTTGPKFEIREYRIEGVTVLPVDQLRASVASFTGKDKDFGDVQKALEVLERRFIEAGFSAVQVLLPEQELEKGVVTFRVVESKIGKVIIENNKYFDEANVRASLRSVREGAIPNVNEIGTNLRLANENPAKTTTVVMRAGTADAEVDAVVRVVDDRTWKGSLSLDNTGGGNTGKFRVAAGLQFANLWNLDHVLTLQVISSPEERGSLKGYSRDVAIFGAGYRIPLYALGDAIDLTFGYSSVNSGVVQNLFNVAGSGKVFGLRYNKYLQRVGGYDHRVVFAYDRREYENNIIPIGTPGAGSLIPDHNVNPISATYIASWRSTNVDLSGYAGLHHNVQFGKGGSGSYYDGTNPATNGRAVRAGNPALPNDSGARGGYRILRFGAGAGYAFQSDWQFRYVMAGQYTDDKLIPGEFFGVGGNDTVRGYQERQFAQDRGVRNSAELYTPDLAQSFGWPNAKFRYVAFVDQAYLSRNDALPGEIKRVRLKSWGLGVRASYNASLSFRLDIARVSQPNETFNGAAGTRTVVPRSRGHFSLAYTF